MGWTKDEKLVWKVVDGIINSNEERVRTTGVENPNEEDGVTNARS